MAEVPEAGPEMVEGPANAKNFDDDVIRNFSEVTSQTLELTGANITGLRSSRAVTEPGNTPYFSSRVYSLPWAILLYESSMYYFNTQYGEYDYLNYIVKGGYGIIYKGRADTVYKSIDIDMKNKVVNREKKFREIYLEAFTQTVLQNDPTYGHNIGRIEKLYRDKSLTTTNPESERRYLFYIKMEHIQFIKFHLYIDSLKGRDGLVSFAAIKPMLRQLAVVLEYFERNYGFYHCDLHRGNVLLKNDPTQLKIIDFGKACMKPTTTGRVFAVEDTPCKSYDILFFIYSFFEAFFMFFAKDAVDFFESLTKLPNGKDLFFYLEEFKDSYSENAKFHVLYPYAIDNRHRFWSNQIEGESLFELFTPLLDKNCMPAGFIRAIDNYSPPIDPAAIRSPAPVTAPVATRSPVVVGQKCGFFGCFFGGRKTRRKSRKSRKGRKQKSRRRR